MRVIHRLLLPMLLLGLSAGCRLPAASPLPDTPKDGDISASIDTKFAEDRHGGLADIIVTTEGGTVTLTGTVRRAERKARAAELARQVPGVKRVKNDVEIHATPAP